MFNSSISAPSLYILRNTNPRLLLAKIFFFSVTMFLGQKICFPEVTRLGKGRASWVLTDLGEPSQEKGRTLLSFLEPLPPVRGSPPLLRSLAHPLLWEWE
jgi:hypothetical protein